jgi:hypothetical protein
MLCKLLPYYIEFNLYNLNLYTFYLFLIFSVHSWLIPCGHGTWGYGGLTINAILFPKGHMHVYMYVYTVTEEDAVGSSG